MYTFSSYKVHTDTLRPESLLVHIPQWIPVTQPQNLQRDQSPIPSAMEERMSLLLCGSSAEIPIV